MKVKVIRTKIKVNTLVVSVIRLDRNRSISVRKQAKLEIFPPNTLVVFSSLNIDRKSFFFFLKAWRLSDQQVSTEWQIPAKTIHNFEINGAEIFISRATVTLNQGHID